MASSFFSSLMATGKSLDNMHDLFIHELRELYDVEKRIEDALPKMADAVQNTTLKEALREHLDRTHDQKRRLELIFDQLEERPETDTSQGIKGIIEEGDALLKTKGDPDVKDAAIISAAQKVEHFEMAGYGSARSFARYLGREDIARILQQTLDEEGEADKKLTEIALSVVNREATRH